MSEASGVMAPRRAWLFVSGAIAESFLLSVFVGWFLARGRGEEAVEATLPAAPVYGSAAVLVVLALLLLRRGTSADATPAGFQRFSFLAMAVLELNALLGLVLSILVRRLEPALTLPGISLAAALLFVLPSGLAFWRRQAAEAPATLDSRRRS